MLLRRALAEVGAPALACLWPELCARPHSRCLIANKVGSRSFRSSAPAAASATPAQMVKVFIVYYSMCAPPQRWAVRRHRGRGCACIGGRQAPRDELGRWRAHRYGHIRKLAEKEKEGVDSVDGAEGILYQVNVAASESRSRRCPMCFSGGPATPRSCCSRRAVRGDAPGGRAQQDARGAEGRRAARRRAYLPRGGRCAACPAPSHPLPVCTDESRR
jgi:hypothetical protein